MVNSKHSGLSFEPLAVVAAVAADAAVAVVVGLDCCKINDWFFSTKYAV